MPNIKFAYLYRDSGNYKNFGSIVFSNADNINLTELQMLIQSKLIDGTWFYAELWQLPKLYFSVWNDKTDHTFHEFECIEYTSEPANTLLTLAQFKALVERTN